MKNKDNIAPTQRFNPPTRHEVWEGGKFTGTFCFVYDGPAWRNKNRPTVERPTGERHPVKGKIAA